ncbi:ATP-grasp domain-containing protein [Rathayibacter sp. CAU 1779]
MSDDRGPQPEPRLLLITGHRWRDTSRLALAARDAGFSVHLLAPRGHPLFQVSWITHAGTLVPLSSRASVAHVLNSTPFDLVVPADDFGAATLFDLYLHGDLDDQASHVVRLSLGDPRSYGIRHARVEIARIAHRSGIAAPLTCQVTAQTLADVIEMLGFPAVLKVDGGFGGQQVSIVDDLDSARSAYRVLSRPQPLLEAVGRLALDHDSSYLEPALRRTRPIVSGQRFVEGVPATLTAVALQGEVLDHVAVRVLRARSENGPAMIVEPIKDERMTYAAEVMARELGLSGFFGLDFILSQDSSAASLIELNPRATPTAHLRPPGHRHPLFHSIADSLGLHPPAPPAPLPAGPIALFPQLTLGAEIDANLDDAHLDLPADDEIAELCVSPAAPAPNSRMERALRKIF